MFATWDLAAEQISENLAKGETSIDVKRRLAHPMPAAQLRNWHTAFGLPQDHDDLRLSVSACLHSKSPRSFCRENYTLAAP
jgi:hypothetical protein